MWNASEDPEIVSSSAPYVERHTVAHMLALGLFGAGFVLQGLASWGHYDPDTQDTLGAIGGLFGVLSPLPLWYLGWKKVLLLVPVAWIGVAVLASTAGEPIARLFGR